MRDRFVVIFFGLLAVVLLAYIFGMQVIQHQKYKLLSDRNCLRLVAQQGSRGEIRDRNGKVIVGSKISYDVLVAPTDSGPSQVLDLIARTIGVSQSALRETYQRELVSVSLPVKVLRNIDLKKAIALEEAKFGYDALMIQPQPVRYYPYGNNAAHVVGYLNEIDNWRLSKLADYGYKPKDMVGFGGIEEKYDYYLRQQEGGLLMEVNHRGKFQRIIGYRPAINGKNVQLTLDMDVQTIAEDVLAGHKGSVVIMHPDSGEILAMCSYPTFNPGLFTAVKRPQEISELFMSRAAPLVNRAISAAYPPGSVFKVIVAYGALKNNAVQLSTHYNCPGFTYVGKQRFGCWDVHHDQNIIQALAHSCDIFFYKTGLRLGPKAIHEYAVKFGLGRVSGLELPYESAGLVPDPLWKRVFRFKGWLDGDTANVSIGQGDLLVTPLQLCRMMAVFANRGTLLAPVIIKTIDGKKISSHRKSAVRLALNQTLLSFVNKGLREAVSDQDGTAHDLNSLTVAVAGKTGTAQATRAVSHGWFAGYFPYDKPQYVICVFLENGGSGHAAVSVAKNIVERMVIQEIAQNEVVEN